MMRVTVFTHVELNMRSGTEYMASLEAEVSSWQSR
jgi:hypothetical protein